MKFTILREVTRTEQGVLDRLERLARAAQAEVSRLPSVRLIWKGESFATAVLGFKRALRGRLDAVQEGQPLPDDVRFVMQALMLWSTDPGNQWGEGSWDSNDLDLTAADYATVPASQNKCSAYVAEVVSQTFNVLHRVYASQQEPGKFFPYRARDWGNPIQRIPNFPVVMAPQMGDVWSNRSHVGIYLGTYDKRRLYVSARDDGDGVFGLQSEIQREHGVQIKVLPEGGVYRRYTP
jgi:hypothetical protein